MLVKTLETRSNIAFLGVFSKLTPNKFFLHPLIAWKLSKMADLRHYKNFAETKNSALVGMQERLTKIWCEKLVGIQKSGTSAFGVM